MYWVFVAVHRLSRAVVSRATLWLRCAGFSLRGLLLLRSMGSRTLAVAEHCLSCQRYVGSPQTRDWIHVPCFGRWAPNYWTTREVRHLNLLVNKWKPYFSYIPLKLMDLLTTPLPSGWEKLWLSDHELNYIINYQKEINRKEWEKKVFLWSWEHRTRKVGLNELPLLEWCDICSFAKLRGWHTQSLWIYKMDLRFLLKMVGRI